TNQAAERFVDQTFGGSLPGFLAAFMSGKKLTEAEAEDLKCLIDRHQEGTI
ncbi:MAG: BlaI/MecI/CopY family transcriptional regulator, partial [Oscillibacter sp.]